jgi:hypothetical protein
VNRTVPLQERGTWENIRAKKEKELIRSSADSGVSRRSCPAMSDAENTELRVESSLRRLGAGNRLIARSVVNHQHFVTVPHLGAERGKDARQCLVIVVGGKKNTESHGGDLG